MKLKCFRHQAWVTCANTEKDAESSIVLAQSLKRVSSNRSVVCMVSGKVSLNLRAILLEEFDFVFTLEEDRNFAKLSPEEYGKLSTLTLKAFDKCCFISPHMLFLKNSDQIFDIYAINDMDFACPENDSSLPIFIFKPSMDSYKILMKALGSRNGTPVTHYIQNWFRNQNSNRTPTTPEQDRSPLHLGPEFNRVISIDHLKGANRNNLIPVTDTCIVNFLDDPLTFEDADVEKLGLLDLHAIKIWKKLYDEHVDGRTSFIYGPSNMLPIEEGAYMKEPLAIIGMSCRYPSSKNLEEFWELLFNGEDGTGSVPPFRWLREQCSRNRPDCRKTNAGFLNVPVDEFDAKFFGISPKEALFMDPQVRLVHECVWEGLEDAAIDPLNLRGSNTGVFFGSWTNDYKDILNHSGNGDFYRSYMGNSIGAAAARISFLLGLTGPSLATESGCSSAMVAVNLACKSLLQGQTNLAVACGVNLLLHPFDKDEMPMMVSPEGHSKTFDEKADGFARGEGCGVLVMKRLSDALRDGDHIWALIRGSGVSQEGVSRSMGTPTVHSESLAMELALKDARVDPNEVSYVEAHGTGTVVGDPMEVSAIAKAYGSKQRKDRLIIGSVKTNVGHTESCSGITGIMKVVLSMWHEMIPPHRNFNSLNPNIDLDSVPAIIPLKPIEWKRYENGKRRIAGVSSFGITGTDAHVIVEEAPEVPPTKIVSSLERPKQLLKISAKTEEALDILLEKYADNLEKSSSDLADICYTANTGRANFAWRAVVQGSSKEEVSIKLRQGSIMKQESTTEEPGKICFLFTGQGSQYPGMAKQLYETSPIFQMHFDYCERILKEMYNISIREVLWGDNPDKGEVGRTIYSQTSIFCVEYALMKLWESWGIKPDYALGHSLGEFGAAVCAGILKPQDAIKLVAERSRLIDNLPRGKMLVIKADKTSVEKVMKEFAGGDSQKVLDFAAINSSEQTVVAGDSEIVLDFAQYLSNKKFKSIVLDASHAFHSKHMDPMLDEYREIAETVSRPEGRNCDYISGMEGSLVEGDKVDADYWVRHTRQPVNFLEASKVAAKLGCQIFIEVGPQPVLSALTMMNTDGMPGLTCLPSLKKTENEWDTLLSTVAKLYLNGVTFDWSGFDELYARKKVRLPHYPFIGKKFWPDMMATTGNCIHPLLGSVIANASSTKLFQNGLNLRCLEYVKDHVIGHTAVFPGAGYLEMALAAGLATVESATDSLAAPTRPMKVENLTIAAPLALEESKTCPVQIVVDFNTNGADNSDWNDLTIKIFHRLDSKWLHHATASFTPLPSGEEIKGVQFDKDKFLQLQKLPLDETMIEKTYDKLASVGLKFGPIFQSLDKVWKGDGVMLAKVKLPPTSTEGGEATQYIVHPAVLDAMIQAVMMMKHSDKIKKRLYVPISISKFLWIASPQGEELFIYTVDNAGKGNEAILVDETGTVIASMSGVELIDTTVKAVESILEQQTSVMPDLWEESWRSKPSSVKYRLPQDLLSETPFSEEFRSEINQLYNIVSNENKVIWKSLEDLVSLSMLNCLYECNWKPEIGMKFTTEELVSKLKIEKTHTKFVNYILELLEQDGFLRRSEKTWEVISIPPEKMTVDEQLKQSKFNDDLVKDFDSTRLIQRVGQNIASIFQGQQSPLHVLFPEDTTKGATVSGFYDEYLEKFSIAGNVADVERKRLRSWAEKIAEGEKFVVRIIEVGAGSGMFSNVILPIFEELNVEFEYMYTDISPIFFSTAEKRFEKYRDSMIFKKLNIEEDPISQGFTPGYYDYVIAADVIHATKDVCQSLKNCRKLLRNGGTIDVLEQLSKNRVITFIFGLMEGFWRFEDFRKDHCTLTTEEWMAVLEQSGFEMTVVSPIFNDRHGLISSWASDKSKSMGTVKSKTMGAPTWLIFSISDDCKLSHYLRDQLDLAERNIITVMPHSKYEAVSSDMFKIRSDSKSDFEQLMETLRSRRIPVEGIVYLFGLDKAKTSQEDILQPYFYLTQTIFSTLKQKVAPRLYAITFGVAPVGDADHSHFHASTLWGFTKSLSNEHSELNCRVVSIVNEPASLSEKELVSLYHELWCDDKETQVAFCVNGLRHVARLQNFKVTVQDLTLPTGTNRFQLILPETKSFADLTFGPLDSIQTLQAEEIEVQIHASALNFRDVLTVLKPIKEFENFNSVGLDMAGVVKRVGSTVTKWQIGDYVFGANMNGGALPSHVIFHQDDVLRVPNSMTLCEAATLPAVFATSYHCLVEVAKVTKEDTVLVHTGSGGVGLSAIELLQNIGAKIITTAGSRRKQTYLRSLGIEHIFNSRNTDFGDEILKLTGGKGVDVVLNSLTSEGFKEASLKACAKGARFVEMSKLSIWTPEEVRRLRPDVKYTVVDLTKASRQEWKRFMQNLEEMALKDQIHPIPYTQFEAVNIREALEYLQKAKQIGKVVCVMPQLRLYDGVYKAHTNMFNDRSSYLITGGLGGIGFEVAKWMLKKGAKHILLAGRNPPQSSIKTMIDQLNLEGANLIPVALDVGNYEQCKKLIGSISKKDGLNLPPLRGIMHAAGTLSDGLIANQNWPKLSSTFNAKVAGTINLHELTKGYRLEHFVLYSSISAIFGTPAQCNHAAGNTFEDAVAHYRHSIGLPATTVNWGQWGEIGVAVEVDLPGLKPMSTLQGISALEYLMKTQRLQTTVLNAESFYIFSKYSPQIATYLDERIWKARGSSNAPMTIKSDEFWQQYESKEDSLEKSQIVKAQLKEILRKILKFDNDEEIEEDSNFQEMGVDSLMFVEIKNHVQSLLGDRVTVTASALRDCNNIRLLSDQLTKLIEGDDSANEVDKPPTMEEVSELIREDCQLPEHITALGRPFKRISEISKILLTGVTGTLGPYILKELTQLPQVQQVCCLIRPSKSMSIQERLEKVLQERKIQVNMSKVRCVPGNVSKSNLGMKDEDWARLSDTLDCVFHCAVRADHTQYYKKRSDSSAMEDVRSVNIGGTKNILEFACVGQVKYVFLASSLLSVAGTEEDGTLGESWPDIADFDGVSTVAYPVSKFVGDMLLKTAVLERGVPAKVFRLPLIAGDSTTGQCMIDHNHLMLRYLYIMKSGIMPSDPFPMQILPVDVCATICTKVFFNHETAISDIYNVTVPTPDLDQEFVEIAQSLGFPIEIVSFPEFAKKLLDEDSDSLFSMFKEVYRNEDEMMGMFTFAKSLRSWIEGVENFWVSKKLSTIYPEFYKGLEATRTLDYLKKDLQYAKEKGWFKKFGLE